MNAAATGTMPPIPSTRLEPDPGILDGITKALAQAQVDIREFVSTHDRRDRWQIGAFALHKLGWPPDDEVEKQELALLHRIADARTPEGIQAANFWSKYGMEEVWKPILADYQRTHGARQAAAAARLLRDTLDTVNMYTQIQKAAANRPRPYDADPTLKPAVDKPGHNPSFPSGHTSGSFAAAIVMGYLMPERAKEFMDMAVQSSYARAYAGVHFPSDIAGGAKIAATIAGYMCSISDVRDMDAASSVRRRHRGRRAAAHAA